MKPVYLKHPVHGSKVTTSEFELEYDKTLGWEVYDPTVNASKSAPVVVEPVIEVSAAPAWLVAPQTDTETPQPAPKRKGGRPPKSAQ